MAKAGFYYCPKYNLIKCPWCSSNFFDWKKGADPYEVHRRQSPSCEYVLKNIETQFVIIHIKGLRESDGVYTMERIFIIEGNGNIFDMETINYDVCGSVNVIEKKLQEVCAYAIWIFTNGKECVKYLESVLDVPVLNIKKMEFPLKLKQNVLTSS